MSSSSDDALAFKSHVAAEHVALFHRLFDAPAAAGANAAAASTPPATSPAASKDTAASPLQGVAALPNQPRFATHVDAADDAALLAALDEYQEQPELLDHHLELIITPLMQLVLDVLKAQGAANAIAAAAATASAATTTASDTASSPSVASVADMALVDRVFRVIYALCKVRGYKVVVKHFPHEASHLEPALALLKAQRTDEYERCRCRHRLLSMIVQRCLSCFFFILVFDRSVHPNLHPLSSLVVSLS
jgi:hypothetical protein